MFYKDVNSITSTNRPDVTDVDAITQALLNLIRTRKGERPFNNDFGLDIEDRLFDLMDDGTKLEILTEIFDAVSRYEPRVELSRSRSDIEFDEENNKIEITLVFSILGFEDDKLFEVTTSLER